MQHTASYAEIVETEGAKPNPESWAEIIGDDPDFEEEFQRMILDLFLRLQSRQSLH